MTKLARALNIKMASRYELIKIIKFLSFFLSTII